MHLLVKALIFLWIKSSMSRTSRGVLRKFCGWRVLVVGIVHRLIMFRPVDLEKKKKNPPTLQYIQLQDVIRAY